MPKELANAEENQRQADAADVRAEAEDKKADETVPGGKFIVDGRTVNSEGEEISGSDTDSDSLAGMSVGELKERARDAGVQGFSTMNKTELIRAINKAEK